MKRNKVETAELISEGRQVLEALAKKLRVKIEKVIEKYAKKMGISEESVDKYFSQGAIKNKKLKALIEADLGKPLDEIVRSKAAQQISMVESVRDNIYLYNNEKDKTLLDTLTKQCRDLKLPYYEVIAKTNYARFRVNLSLYDESIVLLDEARALAKERGYIDLVIFCFTNMAYVENQQKKYSEAWSHLNEAKNIIKEEEEKGSPIENKMILFKFWYTFGLTMKHKGKLPTAKKRIKIALKYAENFDDEHKCIINLGLIHKKEGKYQEALDWYQKALDLCGKENGEQKLSTLNNIAMLYDKWGRPRDAKRIITEAIYLMPEDLNVNRKVYILHTFILVEENIEVMIHQLLEILAQSEKVMEAKKELFEAVDMLLDKLMAKGNNNKLLELANEVRRIINEAVEKKRMVDLRARLGDIFVYFLDKGGIIP